MAQINLLKQNNSSGLENFSPKILVQILGAVFILLAGYYLFLFIQSKGIDSKIGDEQKLIAADHASAGNIPNQEELFVRQQQVTNLKSLLAQHVYMSQIFQPLANSTLSTAGYVNIKVDSQNQITAMVRVPSLSDLDKYLQVFDLDQFNKNFSNVRVGAYSKDPGVSASSTTVGFQVQMDYNPQLLNYKNPSNTAQ